MALSHLTLLLATLFAAPALAGNHFAGIGGSNSIGGTGSYTCRTQAQVCCILIHLYVC